MATTAITRTFNSGGDTLKWTYSMWLKRGTVSSAAYQYLFIGRQNGTNLQEVYFHTDDTLAWYNYKSGYEGELKTERVFRDCTGWYHIQLVWDSANVTSGDRMIIYVNGVRETEFSTENYPDASETSMINTANPHAIGWHVGDSDKAFDGSMSHVQFVDAEALAATEFGEVDSTSGIWKIKTACYATPGTNGFCMKMEDRSNLDLDSSSNAYTFSTTGTGTATYDNPSNNFCTMNPLDNYYCGATLSNGNNSLVTGSSPYAQISSTLAASAGKWYWEVKPTAGNYWLIGAASSPAISTSDHAGYSAYSNAVYYSNGNNYVNNVSSAYAASYTTNDIISVALDLDNNKLYYAKNGAWGTGSGAWDSTTFNAAVGAITITAPASTKTGIYFPVVSDYTGSGTATFQCNFGNGYFGTTAVASTNADDAGIGSFEYDVPTGFYALCTKNIITYG